MAIFSRITCFLLLFFSYAIVAQDYLQQKPLDKLNYHLQRGWDELHNSYHFREAKSVLEKAISENQDGPLIEIYKLHIDKLNERIETFSDTLGNVFPLGPILSHSYSNQHKNKPALEIAVENSVTEIRDNLEGMSKREGQQFIIFLSDGKISSESLNYAFRLYTGIAFLNPYSDENLKLLYPNGLTIDQIKEDPNILKPLYEKEGFDRINILYLEENLFLEDISYVSAKLFRYYLNKPNDLNLIADCGATGVNTESAQNTALVETILVASLIFGIMAIIPFIIFWEDRKKKKDSSKYSSNLIESLRAFAINIILCIIGVGFAYAIGYGSEKILGSWSSRVGSLKIQSYLALAFSIILITPLLLLLLQKITDYVSLIKKPGYLSYLWAGLYSGIGLFMFYYYEYFIYLYPMSTSISVAFSMLGGMILNGAILGEVIHDVIELNSRKSLLGTASIHKNEHENSKKRKKYNLLFLVYIIIISILVFIATHSFFSFFRTDANYSLTFIIILISIGGLLLYLKKNTVLTSPETNKIKKTISQVTTLASLKDLVNQPDKFDYMPDEKVRLENVVEAVKTCFTKEGGVILLLGEKWSGKKRLVDELLCDNAFSKAEHFKIDFKDNPENLNFYPFIQGMKKIPEIHSLIESVKFGTQAKKAASLLSGIFSFIPIAGDFLAKFMDSDIDLTSKENERITSRLLLNSIHTISKELIEIHGNHDSQIIFILDNFDLVDSGSFHLLQDIIELIRDDERSPEKNNIAFLVLAKQDSLGSEPESVKNLRRNDLTSPESIYRLSGLDQNKAKEYFFNTLKFAPNRKNDELFDYLFDIYGFEKFENGNKIKYLFPKYFTETIREMIEKQEFSGVTQIEQIEGLNLFVFKGNLLELSIPEHLVQEVYEELNSLNEVEKQILEVASIFGLTFTVTELEAILSIPEIEILYSLRNLEQKGILIDKDKEHLSYHFKRPIYMHTLRNGLFRKNFQNDKMEPLQLYVEFCDRATRYYSGKSTPLTLAEISRYAETSYFASEKNAHLVFEANLKFAMFSLEIPELQQDGILALNRAYERIGFDSESRFMNILNHTSFQTFLDTFAILMNDYQEAMMNDFPMLKDFADRLVQVDLSNLSHRTKNHITMIAIFTGKRPFAETLNQTLINLSSSNPFDNLWTRFWQSFFQKYTNSELAIQLATEGRIEVKKLPDSREKLLLLSRFLHTEIEALIRFNPAEKLKITNLIEECIDLKKKAMDMTGLAMVLNAKCTWEINQSNWELALKSANEMESINIKMRNYTGLFYTYISKVKILANLNLLDDARELIEKTYVIVEVNQLNKDHIPKKDWNLILEQSLH